MKSKNARWLVFGIPIGIFLITFLWKFWYIGTRDICMDEPFTIFHAQKNILDILKLPGQNEPNPPLFMLLLHFWIKLFGISPYSVRILPLLFNAGTAVFLYLTGKKFFSLWTGIIASGLFIFSTFHFYFGLDARAYSMLSFATSASLYYLFSLIDKPNSRVLLTGLILANTLLVYSHYFGWFVVFSEFLVSFFFIRQKQVFKSIWIALIITGVLFIPMITVIYKQFLISKNGTWVLPPGKSEYINQLFLFLNAKTVTFVLFVLVLTGVVFMLVSRSWKVNLKKELILLVWWWVPYTIMYLVSAKIPMFISQYILYNSIGFYLFIGAILFLLFKSSKILLPVGSIALLLVMFLNLEINSKRFNYREVKNTVNYVKQQMDTNSIILIHPQWADLGFVYYYNYDIFRQSDNFEELSHDNNIYSVWNLQSALESVPDLLKRRIIFYQDGSLLIDPQNTIYHYLDSIDRRTDSVFFPQCFNVSIFEPVIVDSLVVSDKVVISK